MSPGGVSGVADSMQATLDAATAAATKAAQSVTSAVHVAASAATLGVFNVQSTSYPHEEEDEPWPRRQKDNREDTADERSTGTQPPYTVFREWSSKSFRVPIYKRKWPRMLRTAGKPTVAKCVTLILICCLLLLCLLVYVLLEPSKREATGEKNQPSTMANISPDQEDTTEGFWLTEGLPERRNGSQVTTPTTTAVTEEADSATADESESATTYDESGDNAGAGDTTQSTQRPQHFLDTNDVTSASIVNVSAAATTASRAVTTATPVKMKENAGSSTTEGSRSEAVQDSNAEKFISNPENAALTNSSAVS
ncbi:uncharacterized protein LOC144154002 [Haemaphysalis longicornis]